MDFISGLALAKGAFDFAEQVLKSVRDAIEKGEVPADKLQAVREEYNRQRAAFGGRFSGTNWDLSGR